MHAVVTVARMSAGAGSGERERTRGVCRDTHQVASMQEAAVFDSNAYRNLCEGLTIEQARERGRRIAAREAETGRRALCHPYVAAELLAHLADPNDRALTRCHNAIAALAHHCGGDEGVRFIPPPELQLGRSYYGAEDERAEQWLQRLGPFCMSIGQIDDPAEFSDALREDLVGIANGVAKTEAQFIQDMFDHIVKAANPAATTWEMVENKETRRAILKLIDSDEALVFLARGEIGRVQKQLNAPETSEGLNEKAADLAHRFPVPLRFYREVVRRIVTTGSDLTKKKRANAIWDKEIAFYLGDTPVEGVGPVRLVTDDTMIVEIAGQAGVGGRVDRIGDYLDRIGLDGQI